MNSKHVILGVFTIVGLLTMNVAVAGEGYHEKTHDVDVNVDEELDCGAQEMDFSGYVDLHEGHALVVELDDSVISTTIDENSWWTGLHQVGVGAHTLLAYLTNSGEGNDAVSDLWEFVIEECSSPSPSPSPTPSDEPKNEGSNDPGDEQDCETSTNVDACGYIIEKSDEAAPVGQVKGVTKETPTPIVAQKLEKLPSAGPNPLLPLMLVGSWISVAVVGFKKKW